MRELDTLIRQLEIDHCCCGAGVLHRNRPTWEYCSIHVMLDDLRKKVLPFDRWVNPDKPEVGWVIKK